jgi:hypothetical protein
MWQGHEGWPYKALKSVGKNSADIVPYVRQHNRTLNDRLSNDSEIDMHAENTNPWG